jgi:hypothetical protein
VSQLSQVDVLAGADTGAGPVTTWFDALAAFLRKNTPAGGVVIDAP